MEAILSSHYHSTMERIAREKIPVVLAVQDTTSFNYDTHADMEGWDRLIRMSTAHRHSFARYDGLHALRARRWVWSTFRPARS